MKLRLAIPFETVDTNTTRHNGQKYCKNMKGHTFRGAVEICYGTIIEQETV